MRPLLTILLLALLLTPATAAPAPARILVLGDSLSQAVGASSPARGYPAVLARLLGQEVATVGASGRNLAGVAAQWAAYAGPVPAVLVIQVGVNDAAPTLDPAWLSTYRALIADALARGVGRVVVVTPGPVHSVTPGYRPAVAAYADAARTLADVATVADTWPTLGGCPACYPDGVHPNDGGHAEIARLIARALPGLATPAALSVRAVALDATRARVSWEAIPGAVLTCVYAPQEPGACLVGKSPPAMTVRAAWGEPVVVVARSETMTLAVGGASVGPPPIYLPAVEVSR
jgi:lysophospholipase L1-like esterase